MNVDLIFDAHAFKRKAKQWWFLARAKAICDADACSPFRPYGESLFVKRDKK